MEIRYTFLDKYQTWQNFAWSQQEAFQNEVRKNVTPFDDVSKTCFSIKNSRNPYFAPLHGQSVDQGQLDNQEICY